MPRILVAALVSLFPATAFAGPFGGFTADGRYLVGGERLCKPVAGPRANPECAKLTPAQVSRLSLERPSPERGAGARAVASARGTRIEVRGDGGRGEPVRWDAASPVGKVVGVYLAKSGKVAAVEYETRFGGRVEVDVVGLRLAAAAQPAHPAPAHPDAGAAKPTAPELSKEQQAAMKQALARGHKLVRRRRWARAAAEAEKALAIWDQKAEALLILATAELGRKKREPALLALERLAGSSDPEAPEVRVEARTARGLASLRRDPRFRRAVGITPDPDHPPTAYERVMGFGGVWEQRLIACEQPSVKLRLRRKDRRFVLIIKGRCGGPAETTFLDGTWKGVGSDALELDFPNRGAGDDKLVCRIERCRDSSGEDCVRCRVDQDLEFLLRVIRR